MKRDARLSRLHGGSGGKLSRGLTKVVAWVAVIGLVAWSKSWRSNLDELKKLDALIADRVPLIAVFWHGNYLPLFILAKGRSAVVVTNNSFRGSVIAGISQTFGYQTVQIGAGNEGSMRDVLVELQFRHVPLIAVALDGPLGPRHTVRARTLALAADLGYRLLPIAAVSDRKLVLSSRWDKMELPLPFSRVSVRLGEPIQLNGESDGAAMTRAGRRVARAIDALFSQPDQK